MRMAEVATDFSAQIKGQLVIFFFLSLRFIITNYWSLPRCMGYHTCFWAYCVRYGHDKIWTGVLIVTGHTNKSKGCLNLA